MEHNARAITIFLIQLKIIYYLAGSRDLLFAFNQIDAGFSSMLLLFFLAPLVNRCWIVVELKLSVKLFKQKQGISCMVMPLVAVTFLFESLAMDLFLLTQVRM